MRVAGRFALALVLIMVSGSLYNAEDGDTDIITSLLSLLGLVALIWAVVGLVHAVRARARRT